MLANLSDPSLFKPLPDGIQVGWAGGSHSEALVSEIHGIRFVEGSRSLSFIGKSIADVNNIVPLIVNRSFAVGLFNPANSGVMLELNTFLFAPLAADSTVASFGFAYYRADATTTTITLTDVSVTPAIIGANYQPTGVCGKLAWPSGFIPTFWGPILAKELNNIGSQPYVLGYDGDGKILIPPGIVFGPIITATNSQYKNLCMVWTEWPIGNMT